MSEYTQDELPGVDWAQVAKDYTGDLTLGYVDEADLGELEYNEEDEDADAVAQSFDLGEKGVTEEPLPQTAFIVIINPDGDAEAYSTVDKWPADVQRNPSLGDIRRGCSELINEINLQAGARFTVESLAAVVNQPTPADRVRDALRRRADGA